MAEDVEVMSVQEDGDDEANARDAQVDTSMVSRVDSMTANSDITSSNSATQSTSSSATNGLNGDLYMAGDMVSSLSDTTYKSEDPDDSGQLCDCSSSSGLRNQGEPSRQSTSTVTGSVMAGQCSQSTECDDGVQYVQPNQSGSCCPSDTESEIVVDDSPPTADNSVARVVSSNDNDNGLEINLELVSHHYDNGSSYIRPLGRSRSVTPSPSYVRLATPSTPGTPRLRSGSVSGTPFLPASPRPSNQSTPYERPRAGSMGEIEMKERAQGRVKIIDGLDILQLPRPRNPGGILPLNGHDLMETSNEALNLIMDNKPSFSNDKIPRLDIPVSRTFGSSSFRSLDTSANSLQSKQSSSSYMISNIIKSTPNREKPSTISSFRSSATQRQGCSINESVERPKPSSEVDSEGVAKKIARLNSGGFLCSSTTADTLWSRGQTDSLPSAGHLSSVRVLSDKTPPERPKPPRRTVLSPADNGSVDVTGDRFTVSSSVRRRLSSPSHGLRDASPPVNGSAEGFDPPSDVELCPLPHQYKCRLCGFNATSLNMLQMHTSKHGGNKTFRCSQCDYTTQEKSNFRRHRRLHHKPSPINMLKCIKCSFSTSITRRLREHYQQTHPDVPATSLLPGLSRSSMSPPAYLGPQGTSDAASSFHSQFYDGSLLMNRSGVDRLGFPYSMTGRHPSLNLPFDQYNVPYSGFRDRQSENIASSYLRSIVTSIMNGEGSNRQPAATSTVTSSSYFMPGLDNSSGIQDVHSCNGHGACSHTCNMPHSEIKIKVEADIDNVSDVSSCTMATQDISATFSGSQNDSGNASMLLTPGNVDNAMNSHGLRRHRSANADMFSSHAIDVPTDLSSPRKHRTISDTHRSSPNFHRINLDTVNVENISDAHDASTNTIDSSVSDTVVKSDSTTRGIQCVLPVIKTEIDLDGDYYDLCHRPRFVGIDRAVQCNMNNSSNSATVAANMRSQNLQSSRINYRSQSASDTSEHSEQHSVCSESRCEHCGISFEDEVLFSIHIGCHSHTDPFKCNVCGKQCGNKYGFYSHIMRGHHF